VAQRRPPNLRRRWDHVVLRWQARLDGEWADRVLPWIAAAVLAVVYFLLAFARYRSLESGIDLGSFTQAAWLVASGHPAELTLTHNHLLADQAPFAFYPLAWATTILPRIPTLLAVQSAALALGVVPLWRIARRLADLRVGAAAALVFAYAAHPAINNLNLAGFHPEAPAVAALIGATYCALSRKWLGFAVLSTIAVLCRADLAIVIAGLGALLVVEGQRRAGIRTIVAGVGWALLAALVIQPHYGDSGLISAGAFARYGDSFLGVAGSMFAHPVEVIGDLVAKENLDVLILLLAPLLFLPVVAPRYLLPVLPLEALYLVADVPHGGIAGAEYTVAPIALLFVASAFALSSMGRRSIERVFVDRRVLSALVIASTVFFASEAVSSPYAHPWAWGRRDAIDGARLDAVELVPDGAAVRASPRLLALLAERRGLYLLPAGSAPNTVAAALRVDYVILDAASMPDWQGSEFDTFTRGMSARGFTLVYAEGGIEVYEDDTPGS
jgi:uncharacterized membrane protein